jgi:hypothetical protein
MGGKTVSSVLRLFDNRRLARLQRTLQGDFRPTIRRR